MMSLWNNLAFDKNRMIDIGCTWRILKKAENSSNAAARLLFRHFVMKHCQFPREQQWLPHSGNMSPMKMIWFYYIFFFSYRNLRSVSTLITLQLMMQCDTTCTVMSMRRHQCDNWRRGSRGRRRRCHYWRAQIEAFSMSFSVHCSLIHSTQWKFTSKNNETFNESLTIHEQKNNEQQRQRRRRQRPQQHDTMKIRRRQ